MRRWLLCALLLLGGAMLSCGPTIHQALIMDTASYTQCDHVQVDCVDADCSNVQGGPWMATACGTRYRCSRVNDNVTCVPQGDATPVQPMPGQPVPMQPMP